MKKTLSILLSLILLLSLTACGSATMDSAASDIPSMAPGTNGAMKEEMGFDYDIPTTDMPAEAPMPSPAVPESGNELVSSTLPENVKMIYRGYLYLESTTFDAATTS